MRQTKRMAGLLIVTALLMLTALNAFAASGGYVPTTAQVYEYKKGKWVKSYTLKRTYTKDGKLKKQTSTASFSLGDDKYTWKGNYITKASVFTPGKGTIETYTYSKGLRTKYVMDSAAGITTFKYNWTGKKAKVIKAGPGYASSQSVKVNSKKQVISKERTQKGSDGKTVNSYKYFGDGKLKQVVSELKGSDYSSKITRTYNKGGYPVSQESDDLTVTWKYTMDKKKNCPKQVIVSARQSGKTEKFKVVFTTFKKVSKVRNCDAYGREILLVPDLHVIVNGMDF